MLNKKWEAIKQIFIDHKSNSLSWAQTFVTLMTFYSWTAGHGFQIIITSKWTGNTFDRFRESSELIITASLWHDNLIAVNKLYIYINFDVDGLVTQIHVPYLQGNIDLKI